MLRQNLARLRINLSGWSTKRKIIVIESDDWGSIRMPSREIYEECLKAGYPVDKNPFERYDAIESEDDLNALFNLLSRFRDKNGNHPVFTANCVVANPDFDRIKEDDFQKYHYELISDTFNKYPKHSGSFNLWKMGMEDGFFHPQFHCREHLNVSLFMNHLGSRIKHTLFGFEHHMPGSIPQGMGELDNEYVEAMAYSSFEDKNAKLAIYLNGLDLFESLLGYKSLSIIPPTYKWSPDFNQSVRAKGVSFMQGLHKMWESLPGEDKIVHNYYLGQKSQDGIVNLVRNATFEPTLHSNITNDPVDSCLSDIAIAFRMNKPAIITSHRINYIGYIFESNRDRSLRKLNNLLTQVTKRWADVEFLSSDQLGDTIIRSNQQ